MAKTWCVTSDPLFSETTVGEKKGKQKARAVHGPYNVSLSPLGPGSRPWSIVREAELGDSFSHGAEIPCLMSCGVPGRSTKTHLHTHAVGAQSHLLNEQEL